MKLVSVRVVTEDVERMVRFYEGISGLSARWYTKEFAELRTESCVLAIASVGTMRVYGQGEGPDAVAGAGQNRSVIVEFLVEDADREFAAARERLGDLMGEVVQGPTTMPWGSRSVLLRDPDGGLVNLFAPLSAEARARFGV